MVLKPIRFLFLLPLGISHLLVGISLSVPMAETPGVTRLPQSTRALPASAHILKAQEALVKRDFPAVKAELTLALQADPKSAEAYLLLGLAEFQSGETAQAIEHYRRANQLRPGSFSAHYNLAMAYLREQKPQDALPELQRAVSLDPKQADGAYNLGIVLLDLGRPAEALPPLHQARMLNPDRLDAAFNIIRAELEAARVDDARHEADEQSKTFGSNAEWNAAVGRLFLDNHQPREAAARLAEALRLRPESEDIRRPLAAAYLQSGQPQAALDLIQNPGTAEDYYLLAVSQYLLDKLPEADQEAQRALALKPRDPRFLLLRARVVQHYGRHDLALPLLQQALTLAPHWADLYYSVGVSYYFSRRYPEARRSLHRALELDPKSARSFFLYAASLENEGKVKEGKDYLRRAIALEPGNARFLYHLGVLLLRENRLSEAREAFAKASQLKPEYAWPHYQLGKLLADSNQLEAAEGELESAVRYDPELARAYYQLSRIYASLGQKEKSAQALQMFDKLKKQEGDEEQELVKDLQKESVLR